MQRADKYPVKWMTFGRVVGIVMTLGLLGIPGILTRVDSMASLPWYLMIGYFGFIGTYLLYPIWMLRFGQIVLRRVK